MKADVAQATVDVRFTIEVTADGAVRVTPRLYDNHRAIMLSRRWTKRELADDPTLQGNEWHCGGAAIFEDDRATNGPALSAKASQVAQDIARRVTVLVSEVNAP